MLEECNPGIEFDWTRMLKSEAPPQETRPAAPKRQASPQRVPGSRRDRDRRRVEVPTPPAVEPEAASEPDDAMAAEAPLEETARLPPEADFERTEPIDDQLAELDDGAIGTGEDGELEPLALRASEMEDAAPSLAPSAAQARLGTEGIVRLRGRYAEILARIDDRITDPVKRDELKNRAERLNPDAWVTDQEVQAGLEQYETVFESLRAVVGRRRKRRRRRGRTPGPSSPANKPEVDDDSSEAEGDSEDL